ncbi:unnamed protein product [Acanthoscelides obtectus]|uniref:Uncharacterized protein n=1 Tax=Acanthoscelides obtectus TaxID=200917 RepID=A0A9P0M5Y7_ACAOB|nr:unnamed protein product [Acanthoscelides obtectus]CAK1677424.1 hypothetical protein AOBTE_LOCUS31314 [Acanthoscelides obtectus]
MEVLLHESSTATVGNGREKIDSVYPSKPMVTADPEKAFFENAKFSMLPQRSPVDILFENVTYTATEGNICTKKSKLFVLSNDFIKVGKTEHIIRVYPL